MSCGNSIKNRNFKSCERFYNNNSQALTAGTTLVLTLGAKVVDTGVSIETDTQSYSTVTKGLYHISGDVVITSAVADGNGTFSVYMDGVQLPCTVRAFTTVDGSIAVHTETDLYLDSCCCSVNHTFTFVVTSTTAVGTVTNCTGITKLA